MALTTENLNDRRLASGLDALAALDSYSVGWWRRATFDHRQYGADNAILLLTAAERARAFSRSWRDFRVGAAALAIYEGGGFPTEYRLIHGANFKPEESSNEVNIHAEDILNHRALEGCRPEQKVSIAAFAVVGDLQPDQQSAVVTDTLHPCGLCRDSFMHPGSPIGPETLGITANTGFTAFEWFIINALRAYHLGVLTKEESIGSARFNTRPLALSIKPPNHYTKRSVVIGEQDTPELRVSNHEVMRELQLPVSAYARSETEFDEHLKRLAQNP